MWLNFVRDYEKRGVILARYVRSELQLADLMKKAVNAKKVESLYEMMSFRINAEAKISKGEAVVPQSRRSIQKK